MLRGEVTVFEGPAEHEGWTVKLASITADT